MRLAGALQDLVLFIIITTVSKRIGKKKRRMGFNSRQQNTQMRFVQKIKEAVAIIVVSPSVSSR